MTVWKINKGDRMNRIKSKLEQIYDMDNLKKAASAACAARSVKNIGEVLEFRSKEEYYLVQVQSMIRDGTFHASRYNIYTKNERGKDRLIADLPLYPDRIVHFAIYQIIGPELNKKLIDQTHSSIKGRGTHTALTFVRRSLYNDPKIRYCLSMDIDQYYPSLDPEAAKRMMRNEYVKDYRICNLLDEILDGYTRMGRPGIALGDLLSTLVSNLYLNKLDHYIKQVLHAHKYVRFADNFFIFGYSKPWLHRVCKAIMAYLAELGLRVNDD